MASDNLKRQRRGVAAKMSVGRLLELRMVGQPVGDEIVVLAT
jgi:hypothetical protein